MVADAGAGAGAAAGALSKACAVRWTRFAGRAGRAKKSLAGEARLEAAGLAFGGSGATALGAGGLGAAGAGGAAGFASALRMRISRVSSATSKMHRANTLARPGLLLLPPSISRLTPPPLGHFSPVRSFDLLQSIGTPHSLSNRSPRTGRR